MTLIVDAGPLVAAAATRDRSHGRCVELLAHARPLVVASSVWPSRSQVGELLDEYVDLGLGIDRRHFSVVRPRHCPALTLLPE